MPTNLFYGTSIPTCILVFKKCRENPEDVLFIDASQSFEKVTNQNVLSTNDVDKILEVYTNRKVIEKFATFFSIFEQPSN